MAGRSNEVMVLAWMDNRTVTLLSNWHTNDSKTVTGIIRGGNVEEIIKPVSIIDYTKNMRGVDIADQYAASYCFMRKTLKWWRKLFFRGLEASAVNAYILCKENMKKINKKPMNNVQFRRLLVDQLVGNFREGTKRTNSSNIDDAQRLDGKYHSIIKLSDKKRKGCVVCSNRNQSGGRKQTSFICDTCDNKPGLHPECFNKYHTVLNFRK